MKAFKFQYESILKMRQSKEDDIKNELAALIAKLNVAKEQKNLLSHDQADFFTYSEQLMAAGCTAIELKNIQNGQIYYREQLKRSTEKINLLEKHTRETQALLMEAVKERKIMEKLKENAFKAFIETVNASERKIVEEIVNYRNFNNGGLNGRKK